MSRIEYPDIDHMSYRNFVQIRAVSLIYEQNDEFLISVVQIIE